MGKGRAWTQEEIEYLEDSWGMISIKAISKKLNRTVSGIKNKKNRLGLGGFLENGNYITWNQLQCYLKNTRGSGYKMKSWVENRSFPLKYKTRLKEKVKVVYIDDFWKWAEQNRSFLDFSKMEENIFGKEPSWVKKQRELDIKSNRQYRNTPWTTTEDAKLRKYVTAQKYGYSEIAKMLQRTEGAITRRLLDLGIKDRPIKAHNHNSWQKSEIHQLKQMILDGYNYSLMSEKLQGQTQRGSKAIRGLIWRIYGTEVLDKAREQIKQEGS